MFHSSLRAPEPVVSTLTGLTLSQGRRTMVAHYDNGMSATLTSANFSGFSDTDVENAQHLLRQRTATPSQRNNAWQTHRRGWTITTHLNLGPPTWWLPQTGFDTPEPGTYQLHAGWFRVLVALSVTNPHTGSRTPEAPA